MFLSFKGIASRGVVRSSTRSLYGNLPRSLLRSTVLPLSEIQHSVETVVAIENRYHIFLCVLFRLEEVRPLRNGERFLDQQTLQAHSFLPTIKCDFA